MVIQQSAEDYLEAMLILRERKGYIRAIDIAAELGITKPSVSYAVKRLRENGYITVAEDNLISLTDAGLGIAKTMYERHTLLTDFLINLGVEEATAAADACKIEHDLSPESFAAIRAHVEKNSR